MKHLSMAMMALFLTVSLFSCKKEKIVEGVAVSTEDVSGEKMVRGDFDFGFEQLQFPSFYWGLPKNWGSIEIANLDGQNKVILDLNISELLKLPEGEAILPNGGPVPLVIRAGGGIVFIDIPKINGRIYVAHKNGETMVGFAISIKGLDGIGNSVGELNVFPEFKIKKMRGVAGIFSGVNPGETGLAAFVIFGGSSKFNMLESASLSAFEFAPSKELTKKQERKLRRALRRIKRENKGRELQLN